MSRMVQCVAGCSAPHGAVFLPTAGCHVPGVGAAWSDCSPVAHTLLRLEHIQEGCGQKFKQKRWWCVFVNNGETSSHVVLSSLQRPSAPWLGFPVPSLPLGDSCDYLPICARRHSEPGSSLTQQEAEPAVPAVSWS